MSPNFATHVRVVRPNPYSVILVFPSHSVGEYERHPRKLLRQLSPVPLRILEVGFCPIAIHFSINQVVQWFPPEDLSLEK